MQQTARLMQAGARHGRSIPVGVARAAAPCGVRASIVAPITMRFKGGGGGTPGTDFNARERAAEKQYVTEHEHEQLEKQVWEREHPTANGDSGGEKSKADYNGVDDKKSQK
jgi:hypothetical protein